MRRTLQPMRGGTYINQITHCRSAHTQLIRACAHCGSRNDSSVKDRHANLAHGNILEVFSASRTQYKTLILMTPVCTSCNRRAHPIPVQMRGIINLAVDLLSQSAADGTLHLLLGVDNKRPIKMQIDSAHAFV